MKMISASELKVEMGKNIDSELKSVSECFPEIFHAIIKPKVELVYGMTPVSIKEHVFLENVRFYIDFNPAIREFIVNNFVEFLKNYGYEVDRHTSRDNDYISVKVPN